MQKLFGITVTILVVLRVGPLPLIRMVQELTLVRVGRRFGMDAVGGGQCTLTQTKSGEVPKAKVHSIIDCHGCASNRFPL
eukprot:919372-Amphidinium_carterae.1